MSLDNYVTIRTYHDHILADIIMAALHDAGIHIFRMDDSLTVLPHEMVEIKVHESDVEAALEIIEYQEGL
ncbi:MAG: DUF2007 domain-containing protein [Saprospiraceae bacterium]|nr:DUF2007 domain-containing protein [Saprospiraceae bacterium]